MNLFGYDPGTNLLPCDGVVNYFGPVLGPGELRRIFDALLNGVRWQKDEVVINGARVVTARKVAWYGDDNFSYTYSGTTKHARVWTPELRELRDLVERLSSEKFNSCLCNLYHHGGEGMSWHSDDESALVRDSAIASLSFGAERKFCFRHKRTEQTTSVVLEDAGLLLMRGATQRHWLHSLPKTATVKTPRINLTFRSVVVR